MALTEITLPKPDDWHVHLRDHEYLATTVPATAAYCQRAIVMPNLKPPVTVLEDAIAYKNRIMAHVPQGNLFTPLMTLYFTEKTSPEEIINSKKSGIVHGIKLYPAGATTNSNAGVADIDSIYPLLEIMQEVDLPLLIHGEVVDRTVDVFDREKVFIERYLTLLVKNFPKLRIVLEHITTAAAVDFIKQASENVAATITPQHLLYDRNALFQGGLHPHLYCLPLLKRQHDQIALMTAATSGHPRFFLGTDSAPHTKTSKECSVGCAGIYTAPLALSLYAEAFEVCDKLDRLAGFASHFGADFYRLERNKEMIYLERKAWEVPESYPFGDGQVIPLRAGETMMWQIAEK